MDRTAWTQHTEGLTENEEQRSYRLHGTDRAERWPPHAHSPSYPSYEAQESPQKDSYKNSRKDHSNHQREKSDGNIPRSTPTLDSRHSMLGTNVQHNTFPSRQRPKSSSSAKGEESLVSNHSYRGYHAPQDAPRRGPYTSPSTPVETLQRQSSLARKYTPRVQDRERLDVGHRFPERTEEKEMHSRQVFLPQQHSHKPSRQHSLRYDGRPRYDGKTTSQPANAPLPAEQSMGRYVDQYDESKYAPMIETGKDKVKRFFGRARKEEKTVQESVTSSEDEGVSGSLGESGSWEQIPPAHAPSAEQSHKGVTVQMNSVGRRKAPLEGKPPQWLDWKGKGKGSQSEIMEQINALCATDEQYWSEDNIFALCNKICRSEAASKEAVNALRKEFRRQDPEEARMRAVKLWINLYVHTSDRFKLQVATKRFLESMEDLYNDKRTSTRTRGRLLVAWSMVTNDVQFDSDLQSIVRMYNKIKPGEMPVNGSPLDLSHDLFLIGTSPVHSAVDVDHETRSWQANVRPVTHLEQHQAQLLPDNNVREAYHEQAPPLYTSLHEACNTARINAQVLMDSLVSDGLGSSLVEEFVHKTRSSQDFIVAQISWASSQVERNHLEAHADGSVKTQEDDLMDDLVDAHEKVITAVSMVEEAEFQQREKEEEAQAIDRSMREMRVDRSQLVQDPNTGHFYDIHELPRQQDQGMLLIPSTGGNNSHASGSRSPSPIRRPLPEPEVVAPPVLPSLSASSAPTTAKSQAGQNFSLSGPRPMQSYPSPQQANRANGSSDEDVPAVSQPSEKALGKRRAVSNDFAPTDLPVPVSSTTSHENALLARPPPALPPSQMDIDRDLVSN